MNTHGYAIRPRKDKRGVNLISDALPFGRLWYDTPDHAIGYAMHSSHSHHAVGPRLCVDLRAAPVETAIFIGKSL
jgi:hypothetical protein